MARYCLKTKNNTEYELTSLYENLRENTSIDIDNFNIEGAVFTGKEWLLFNRGNGRFAKNGIFRIASSQLDSSAAITFIPVELPNIKHVTSSFTDAVQVGSSIFFLAAAEDTLSTYDDGEVLGSIIGCLDLESFELQFTEQISTTHKFEGLALFNEDAESISFLLCEDKDTEEMRSSIYKLTLTRHS